MEGGGERDGGRVVVVVVGKQARGVCVLAGSRALRWDVVSPALRRETPVVRDSGPVWFCSI